MINNKKLSILLIIIFFIILLNSTSVFATDYTDNALYNKMLDYTVSNSGWDGAYYILFTTGDTSKPYACVSASGTQVTFTLNSSGYFEITTTSYSVMSYTYFDGDGNFVNRENNKLNAGVVYDTTYVKGDYLYSTKDLYDYNNEIVSPLVVGLLHQEVVKVEMKEVLKEVLVILPVILSVLVSLVALRKGLRALSNTLHKV